MPLSMSSLYAGSLSVRIIDMPKRIASAVTPDCEIFPFFGFHKHIVSSKILDFKLSEKLFLA